MNSRAVKDYFRSFHLKQLVAAESVLLYIYLLVGPVYFLEPHGKEAISVAMAIYYCGMVPMLLGMTGMRLNPIGLPKIMFLCPMSFSQREEYVRAKFWARFWIPAILFIVIRLIWWIVFPVQVLYLLADAMLLLGMLGGCFMTLTGSNKALEATVNQPKLLREKEIKGVDVKGLLSFLIGVLTWFAASAGIADGGKVHIAVWIVAFLLLLWQVWMTVKMLACVKFLIPLACDYERMNV
nr:hypothetical protein [Lachnospiraceae bacterium]